METGKLLPLKPVMLTFDDNDANQFEFAKPIMDKYGFKAVYFIMTVSLNKKNYFSTKQVKQLADEGNVIGSHTWDHKNIKKYVSSDWERQIDKPRKLLEEITQKPVHYFAYPFGVWNKESIPELKKRKFRAAFQLGDKVDNDDPLFTIRRIIVPGSWSAGTTFRVMQRSFRE
jgi:peptidoglycan/xylan/chitin deacetylase (PgdA/CDA1 family)